MARGFADGDSRFRPAPHLRQPNPARSRTGFIVGGNCGGLLLARQLLSNDGQRLSDERVLELATELEGHPDNVAPALLGGVTIAWQRLAAATAVTAGGSGNSHSTEPAAATRGRYSAHTARHAARPGAAATTVPHADAAANAARAAPWFRR